MRKEINFKVRIDKQTKDGLRRIANIEGVELSDAARFAFRDYIKQKSPPQQEFAFQLAAING